MWHPWAWWPTQDDEDDEDQDEDGDNEEGRNRRKVRKWLEDKYSAQDLERYLRQ